MRFSITFDESVRLQYKVEPIKQPTYADPIKPGYFNSLSHAKSYAWQLAQRERCDVSIEVAAIDTESGKILVSDRKLAKVTNP